MNKKKKLLRLICLSSFVLGTGSVVFATQGKNIFKSFANTTYSCDLPDGYVEILDVLEKIYSDAKDDAIDNPYTFRGTVSKRFGDFCFIQRVNQENYYLDAIKVRGLNTYANELTEGSVVDISGGRLFLEDDTPTVILTDVSQHVVSFNTNPFGCEPREYSTLTDCDNRAFDNEKDDWVYGSNRYVKIQLNHIFMNEEWTIDLGSESYHYGLLLDPTDDDFACHLLFDEDQYDEMNEKVQLGNQQGMLMSANCVMYYHGGYFGFLIKNANDITITDEPNVDMNVISNIRTQKFKWSTDEDSGRYFNLYNIVGKADVPYVEACSFINDCYGVFGVSANYFKYFAEDNYIYYRSDNFGYVVINCETDKMATISFNGSVLLNTARTDNGYRYLNDPYGPNVEIEESRCEYHNMHDNIFTESGEPQVSYQQEVDYDLGLYGLDIVKDKFGHYYVPLTPMVNIFLTNSNCNDFIFNGDDLYHYYSTLSNSDLYNLFISSSPFVGEETRTQAMADYTYGALCFSLKYCYGLIEDRTDGNVDQLLDSLGVKTGLLSTSCVDYEMAVNQFTGQWLYEGHAGLDSLSPFGYIYNQENSNVFMNTYNTYLDNNARRQQLASSYFSLASQREAAGKGIGLSVYDDTAIITFDEFVKCKNSDYSLDVDDYTYEEIHEIGSELLFKKAFKEITANDDIKNVVIDLTYNTGGTICVIPSLLAYLTANPSYTMEFRIDDEVDEIGFKVDLDEDGEYYGEGDTYEGKYNFYCMNSRLSFSCGNYLPTILKTKGWATLIGERSGGGICSVGAFSSACGTIFRGSSNMRLGYYDETLGRFNAFEDGVEPDYEFSRDYFYNDEEIYKFIHSLQS